MEKDIKSVLDEIDKINPFASYLDDSSLSFVDEWIDTGSYVLNAIISGSTSGGIPKGRVTMLAGESMTGKSLFVCKILASAQKQGLIPVIFDTENAIDPAGAARLGLDIKNVKYVPTTSIEQTRNSIYNFLEKVRENGLEGKFIIAIDSLGNLQSELELKRMTNDNTSSDMGSRARAIKSLMQTCTNLGSITNTTVLITNHVYDDPSAMYPSIEKNMSGGKSVKYLPSVTVQLTRKPMKDDGGKISDAKLAVSQKKYPGIIIRALTLKNRFIKQYLEGEIYLSFSSGLDRYYGLLDIATGLGALIQTGSTYTLEGGKKIGYYKAFRSNTELWENTIIPIIEQRMKAEWNYANLENNDIPPEVDPDELAILDSADVTDTEEIAKT